jgi:hypothetical protein
MADLEAQVATAVRRELERQAEATKDLSVSASEGTVTVHGPIDVEALAMALVGAVAGGP